VLAEQHDEWTEGRRYLFPGVLTRARARAEPADPSASPAPAARSTPRCTPPEPAPASGTTTAARHPPAPWPDDIGEWRPATGEPIIREPGEQPF
jgi:hypothetical protein